MGWIHTAAELRAVAVIYVTLLKCVCEISQLVWCCVINIYGWTNIDFKTGV